MNTYIILSDVTFDNFEQLDVLHYPWGYLQNFGTLDILRQLAT